MEFIKSAVVAARSLVAMVLISAIFIVPTTALAGEATFGAKISIDSSGSVEVNNVKVYEPPDDNLYADSGEIVTDATEAESEDKWYTPTWGKFAIGLATVGVVVGVFFIVDNNVDDDDFDSDDYYYDSDCDCFRRR